MQPVESIFWQYMTYGHIWSHYQELVLKTDPPSFHCIVQCCWAPVCVWHEDIFVPSSVAHFNCVHMVCLFCIMFQLVQRVLIMFMPPKYQPDYMYLRHVPLRRVHLFTAIQIVCLIGLWVIKTIKEISIIFPVMVRIIVFHSDDGVIMLAFWYTFGLFGLFITTWGQYCSKIAYFYLVPFQSSRRLLLKFWTLCIFEPPFGGWGATYGNILEST